MMCSHCKKNIAVVFVTRMENGKTINEGLCLPCAQKLGIDITKSMEAMGLNPEDMDNIEEQMANLFEMPGGMMEMLGGDDDDDNPIKNFFKLAGENAEEGGNNPKKDKKKKKSLLDSYGTNITKRAAKGKVDPVVGRDSEITRCIEILNRRTKNNPCLIGEPGVGKTAIAEGLATRIVLGTVPEKLLNYEIFLLDFTSLVAGTQFRGQFEQRLKGVLEEVKKAGNIILVIDELHNIVGAGDAEGAMSAANILKPALARGEIQIIGATTTNEYRKFIEKDTALERRFQTVMVDEPTVDETIEILKGLRPYYESYHKVSIPTEVLISAVKLSERYITDRFLPDKAIDIIDEASSRANLKNTDLARLGNLTREIEATTSSVDELSKEENYEKVAELKVKLCRLEEEKTKLEETLTTPEITSEDVAKVIEKWTKIPAASITKGENEKLLSLPETLRKRVKGQDRAIDSISAAILRNRVGLSKKHRPVSFIFTGSTGVGKTELVLSLAEAMFDTEEALIRLDMSEYMEKHAVSKIIGAPPGYVGYDDAGQLTEKVRRKPYSIILLDEIEKAHADVLNILLQIFEDGRITDSHGKVVNFQNTVIIMTSNAGSDHKGNAPGFTSDEVQASEEKVKTALKEFFRPEFINRIDEIVIFNALSKDVLLEILRKLVGEFSERLSERDIEFEISENALSYLMEKGYDPKNGARPLRRIIQKELEDKTAKMIVEGTLLSGQKLKADLKDEKIVFFTEKL